MIKNPIPPTTLKAPPPIAAVPSTVNPNKNQNSAQPDVAVVPMAPLPHAFTVVQHRNHTFTTSPEVIHTSRHNTPVD